MITKKEIKKELYKVNSPFEKRINFSKHAIETYTNLVTFKDNETCHYCFSLTESTLDERFSFICVIKSDIQCNNLFFSDTEQAFDILLQCNLQMVLKWLTPNKK